MSTVDDPARTAIAARLREARQQVGLSPHEVARRAGVATGNYYLLESGSGNPTVVTLLKLAEGLDCDPGDLLRGLRRSSLGV